MHSSKRRSYPEQPVHPTQLLRHSKVLKCKLRGRTSERNAHSAGLSSPHTSHFATVGNSVVPFTPINASELRQLALAEAKAGNHCDAIALFDQLLEQNPASATDYNNRGLVHFNNQEHEKALADYNRAIALDETLDSVYNNRANYHAYHGDLLWALLDYDKAIDLNPYNVRAWINQGITFRDLQLYSRAVECFEAALQFAQMPEHIYQIYLEKGRSHHLRGDWNCAIADYQNVTTYVVEESENLGDRELQLLIQAQDWMDDLLSPLGIIG